MKVWSIQLLFWSFWLYYTIFLSRWSFHILTFLFWRQCKTFILSLNIWIILKFLLLVVSECVCVCVCIYIYICYNHAAWINISVLIMILAFKNCITAEILQTFEVEWRLAVISHKRPFCFLVFSFLCPFSDGSI